MTYDAPGDNRMTCPRCGAAVTSDAQFCTQCGAPLAAAQPQGVPAATQPYPVLFDVDYPGEQSRWKAISRLVLVVPALLFVIFAQYAVLFALFPMWLAILVRGRAPRWLFDFQVGFNRFYASVQAYFSLLTDAYPAFDGPYPVHYDVAYPERLSRWKLVIWKFFTSLPQWIVVWVLQYAAFAIVTVGWISIVFSKQFPKGLHSFVVGTMRWRERVYAYSISLTDEYPPYSLAAEASATKGRALWVSSAVGVLGFGGATAGIVALIVALIVAAPFEGDEKVVEVSYGQVVADELVPGVTVVEVNSIEVELLSALDPADEGFSFYAPPAGSRLVLFTLLVTNENTTGDRPWRYIGGDDFELTDFSGDENHPILAVIDDMAPPVRVDPHETVTVEIVFVVPSGADPVELSFDRRGFLTDTAIFRFY